MAGDHVNAGLADLTGENLAPAQPQKVKCRTAVVKTGTSKDGRPWTSINLRCRSVDYTGTDAFFSTLFLPTEDDLAVYKAVNTDSDLTGYDSDAIERGVDNVKGFAKALKGWGVARQVDFDTVAAAVADPEKLLDKFRDAVGEFKLYYKPIRDKDTKEPTGGNTVEIRY